MATALRVVLWVAGCSHHCPGCQNPVTWDPEDGLPFDRAAEEEIFGQLEQEYISGLTLSGGDPLYEGNREAVTELVRKVKSRYPKKTIWLYTGYRWEEIRDLEVIRDIDVVVDGRYIQEERDITLEWRGKRQSAGHRCPEDP